MSAGAIPTFAEFSHSLEPPQATQAQPTQKIPTFAQFAQDEGEDNSDTITPQQANAFKGDPFDGLKATTPQAPPAYTGPKNLGAILTRVPPSPTHGGPGYGPNDIPKPAPMPGTPNERMRQAVSEGLNMHPDLPMPDNTGVVSGVTRGLEKTVQGALTPGNAALAIGTAGAGPIIQRLVAGGFSLQMLTEAYNKVPEVKAAIDSGDYGKAAEVATEAIGTLVMGAAAGKHALTAPKPLTSARDFGLQEGNAEPVAAAEMPDAFNAQPRPTPGMPAPPTQAPKLSTEELTAKIRDIAATRGSFGVPFLQRETGATYAEIQPILDQFVQDKTLAQAKNARGRVYHISRESRGPSVEAAATHTPPEVASPAAVAAPESKAAPQEEPHEFSSTQVNLPPELHAAHSAATAAIPDAELADDGRETEPHITAKFGLKADTPDTIREAVRGEGPITATLGKASIFDNPKFDVLKLDVDSPDLHRINGKLAKLPNGDKHPDYTPHVTLGYLKKGEGAKYVGKDIPGLTGKEITFDSVDFSGKDRTHTQIPLEGPAANLPGATGREATVYTPTETKMQTQYRVVPADSLRTSFDQGYPQELQPRDTNRAGSRQRIETIKGTMNPEKMGESVNAGDGAPIVTTAGDVVTRNHGTQSLRELYDANHENGENYKQWLTENAARFGIKPEEVASIDKPVLVRQIQQDVSPQELAKFAEDANMPSVARPSDAEQSMTLAKRISGPVMDAFNPREDGTPNPEFVQAVMAGLPAQEQSAFMDRNGQLSQSGIRMMRNAVFAKAYPDISAVERMAESTDDAVKNISNGMLAAAPKVARLQEAISRGDRHPLGIEKGIAQAASVLEDLKTRGMTVPQWLAQTDMFGRDPVVENLVKVLDEHKRSAARIGDVLKSYTDAVDALGDPKQEGLFGPQETPNESELITAANKFVNERRAAEEARGKTADLFADSTNAGESANPPPHSEPAGGNAAAAGQTASEPPNPINPRRKRQRGSFSNKAIASPSYDQTRKSFIDNLGLEGDEKSAFEKSVSEWEKKNPGREVVSFQDVRDEAKKYGPEVVSQLTRPEANETMDPAVRQAARDALAGISAKVDELTKQFGSMNKDVDTTAYLETAGKIDALRKQQDNLIDVLIPTRSQDGRNLVYWRMAAQKSFDPIYWLARATKEAGGALPPATRGKLTEILERGRRAQAEGGTANVVRQDLAQEMSKIQKSTPWETITALRKMGLMGVKTHLRNIGGNLGFQLLEETQRIPASMIDMALSLASGERTVEGMSPDSFSKATYAAATRGAREFVETLKHGTPLDQLGKSELHRELNSGNKLVDAWVNYNSRMLSAEDRLFKVYAFERSLQEQQKLTGITEPTDTMRARAIADAEYATFNNRNVLSTAWNSGISQLNKGGVTGKAAALVAETTVPFVRTPTNILARLIDYTPPGAAVRVGYQAIKAAVDREFTPEAQRAISNGIGRGLTGSALIYMGYQMAKAGKATGAAQYDAGARNVDEAAGRVPGSILIGDKWRQINQFSPEGGLFTLGATLERESTRGLKNELKRPQNMLKIATDTVMQQPMLEGTNQLIESIQQPGKKLDNFVGSTAGSFVPTLAAEAATAGDTKRRDIHAEGLLDSVVKAAQMRVPGWRNQLPARKDVFGKEEPQNRASAVDPTIGSTAKETSDPVIKELIDRGLKLSKITEPKATSVQNVRGHEITKGFNETPEEMQLRNDIEGALIYRVLSRVTQAPGYKALPTDANDDTRRLALERAVSRVRNPGPESGGINLNRLANSPGWAKLPAEQRIQRLQSILRRVQ